jgi:glutamate racemase
MSICPTVETSSYGAHSGENSRGRRVMGLVASAVVGVFDSGIGGIPLAARLSGAGHAVIYLGDAARRPYGPQPNEIVAQYVAEAEQFFADAHCDLWVIACNTASVVARGVLQNLLPCVDMVAAVQHEYPSGGRGRLGLLATAGTVASGIFPALLSTYEVHQVATEELLRIAEEGGGQSERIRTLASIAFGDLRRAECTAAVLACTDFTCVMADLASEAYGIRLVDPIDAAVELVSQQCGSVHSESLQGGCNRLVLTGPHPIDVQSYARDRFELSLPSPEYVTLAPIRANVSDD